MADLADLARARQEEVTRRADRAVRAVERAVRRTWLAVLAALSRRQDVLHRTQALLARLPHEARTAVALELATTAQWGHRSARAALVKALPRRVLALALERRRRGHHHAGQLRESLDLTALWRPGASLLDLLFPAPDEHLVHNVIYSSGWEARIRSGTGLGDPAHLAHRIATGLSLGRPQQEIARDLMPAVQGVQSSARRIARTESLRVAGAMQMRCHRQLGDLVIGYRVHATLDANTRPEHRARDGTVYYHHPAPGQKGMDECPHPPQEADGSTAWSCRCYLTPVLRAE